MTSEQSIKGLYALALAEGEGVGTAYEYYAKRLLLLPWLKQGAKPKKVLIAGLPEKYGASLDFLLLGAEMEYQITVVDDRPAALSRLKEALASLPETAISPKVDVDLVLSGDISRMDELVTEFDLVMSSEVLQRLSPDERAAYGKKVLMLAPKAALFTPNADNDAHTGLSGLSGLTLAELNDLITEISESDHLEISKQIGYIDMPPFPPGITRTDDQREDAASGAMEALAMWGLGYYARVERLLPTAVRRKWSHIVYALIGRSPR